MEVSKVVSHFLKGGEIWECKYWVIPRKDKEVCHLKVAGSERKCECQNRDEIRRILSETRSQVNIS